MSGLLLVAALAAAAELAPPPDDAGPVLDLPELVRRTEASNGDLAAMRARGAQADAQLRKAWSSLLPVVTAAASYTRNSDEAILAFPDFRAGFQTLTDPATGTTFLIPNEVAEIVIQPYDQVGALGKVTVPLLVMPAYYGISAADEGAAASAHAVEAARSELLFGVAQAYYGAVASQRLIELAKKQLDAAEKQERLAKARFDAGQVPKIAFLRAGVDRARAEQDVRRAENGHAAAKLALAALAGIDGPFQVVAPPPQAEPAGAEEALVEAALAERPDLAAARAAAAAADDAVDAEWWKLAPTLAASAEYRASNVEGFTGDKTMWLVQVAAVITLYDGGRYADLDLARARLAEAEASRSALARRVVQEVKTARLELSSARANLLKAREQAKLAEENAALVDAQVASGLATYLDAVDASAARFAAGVAAVSEELNVEIATLKLAKATGRLFEAGPDRSATSPGS